MRLRNTIIALVLLAIVGGYAFIVGRYSVPEAPQRLIDVKQDDIAKIELRYSDRDIVLARDKDKPWRLVKPIGADADQNQANNLARAIAEGVLVRTVDDQPTDLVPFGLKPPTTTVAVTTFVWLAVTFLTAPETDATLIGFYRRVRPSVPGWRRIAKLAPDVLASRDLGWNLLDWLCGCALVYGALFGIGKIILKDYASGFSFIAVAAAAAGVIYWDLSRRGWSSVME